MHEHEHEHFESEGCVSCEGEVGEAEAGVELIHEKREHYMNANIAFFVNEFHRVRSSCHDSVSRELTFKVAASPTLTATFLKA